MYDSLRPDIASVIKLKRRLAILEKVIFASLVLLLILTPLPYGTVENWSVTVWELWVFLTVLLWGVKVVKEGQLKLSANPLIWPLLGLLLVAVVQILPVVSVGGRRSLSYDSYATLQAAIKLLAMIFFFLLFTTFVSTDESRYLVLNVVIALAFFIAIIGIGQSYVGKVLWQRGTFGPFVNRNHFAGFLEMGLGLAAALVVGKTVSRERLAIYLCILLVLVTGVVLSASRGGNLALAAEIVFLALVAWPARAASQQRRLGALWRVIAAAALFVVMVVGAIFFTGSDELVQNLSQLQKETQTEAPASERFSRRLIWRATAQMIKDHPLWGVGLGAYPLAYTRYDPSSGMQRVEQSHNDYLQIVADAGLVGGLLALSFLLLLFSRGFAAAQTGDRRHRVMVLGALTGCFAIAVHSFVDFNLQVTANAQLFLALASLATSQRQKGAPPPAYSFQA